MPRASIVLVIIVLGLAKPALGQVSGSVCLHCGVNTGIAVVSGGPPERLQDLYGADFDWAYILTMYEQNSDIIKMAALGMQKSCDPMVRLFSRKIARERMDMNDDLKIWYSTFMNRTMPQPDQGRYAQVLAGLACLSSAEFDCSYAAVMSGLMAQSEAAALMAIDRTSIPEIRMQARIVERTNRNEVDAFQRWQQTGSLGLRK